MYKHRYILAAILIITTIATAFTQTQDDLAYRIRGNRSEGILVDDYPATRCHGEDFLIGARAVFSEPTGGLTDKVKVKFYIPSSNEIISDVITHPMTPNLRVVERLWMDHDKYIDDGKGDYGKIPERPRCYILDNPSLAADWKAGYNYFEWPYSEVMGHLGLGTSDVEVLLRLGKPFANIITIAPVIVYRSQPPQQVNSYIFDFNVPSSWPPRFGFYTHYGHVYRLLPPNKKFKGAYEQVAPILTEERNGLRVTWDARQAKEGWYQLWIKISSNYSTWSDDKAVYFYHKPFVSPE
jgi:hypothetical protein